MNEPPSLADSTNVRRRAAWIVAFWLGVAAVRIAAVSALSPGLSTDPDAYVALAESWRRTGTYGLVKGEGVPRPTAFRPPAYPALLAATSIDGQVGPWRIAILNVALGLATVGGTVCWGYAAGRPRAGWIAGGLVAVDPLLLHQSAQPMTETPAACLAVWLLATIAWASRRGSSWAFALPGALLGVACLTRPTFLPLVGIWGAYLLAVGWVVDLPGQGSRPRNAGDGGSRPTLRTPGRGSVARALVLVIVAGLFVGGWTLRNAIELGSPVVATTHGGYTLLLGNNEDFYRWLSGPPGRPVWEAGELQRRLDEERPAKLRETEVHADRRLADRAEAWIAAHPREFLACCVYRIGRFWSPLPATFATETSPTRRGLALAAGAWYVVVYLLALAGLYVSRRRLLEPDLAPALLLAATFVAIHAVYWTDVRMRSPVMPAVLFLAALALSAGWDAWRRDRRS